MIVLVVVLALAVGLALAFYGLGLRHAHLPGCSHRRAGQQVATGDMLRLAGNSADGMAFRYAFASPLDTMRWRSRWLPTNPHGDRVEIRVVAEGHVGQVFGPVENVDGKMRRRVYELDPGVWVTRCDAAGRARELPVEVK